MKFIVLDNTIDVENQLDEVNNVFSTVNDTLKDSNLVFSHLLIDGKEYYDEYEVYISENVKTIKEIEVVVKTTKEIVNDVFLSMESYLQEALPEIESLVNEFYNNPTQQTWTKYEQLLEGLHWIVSVVTNIDQMKHSINNWNECLIAMTSLENELQVLIEAMENKDYVLIADAIQYEMMPILETVHQFIITTIDSQGVRKDLN